MSTDWMAFYGDVRDVDQLVTRIWSDRQSDKSQAKNELMCAASKLFAERLVSRGWKLVISKVIAGLASAEELGYVLVSPLTGIICNG